MTTVAAVARDGHVVMAADSLSNIYDRPVTGVRKLRRCKTAGGCEALFGFSGQIAVGTVLDADLNLQDIPEPADGDLHLWAQTVARKLSAAAVSSHVTDEGKMDGTFLLGYAGRLWTVCHMVAIEHPDGIAAIGSGEGPAMGAMHTLLKHTDFPPQQVVAYAVDLACKLDKHSEPPIWMELLPATAEVG